MLQRLKSRRDSRKQKTALTIVEVDEEPTTTDVTAREKTSTKVKNFFKRFSRNPGNDEESKPEDYDIQPYDNNVDAMVNEVKQNDQQNSFQSFNVQTPEASATNDNGAVVCVEDYPQQTLDSSGTPISLLPGTPISFVPGGGSTGPQLSLPILGRCHSIESVESATESHCQPLYNYTGPGVGGAADLAGPFSHRLTLNTPGARLPAKTATPSQTRVQSATRSNASSGGKPTRVEPQYEEDSVYENMEFPDNSAATPGSVINPSSHSPKAVLDKMKRASQIYEQQSCASTDVSGSDDESFFDESFDNSPTFDDSQNENYVNVDFDEVLQANELRDKLHHIVYELMTTEEAYVERLGILNKAKLESEKLFDKEIANQMFPYIDGIYELHKENMLPHIQERVHAWKSNKRIGDIMKRFAPYLKLYTDYVKNFDGALQHVEHWNEKSPEFRALLLRLQSKGPSKSIKVQIKSHMLEPIQRVPRYELLLKEYLKNLPEGSTDRQDAESAKNSVAQASRHFEEMMTMETNVGKLIQIERQLTSPVSIISKSRSLVKEGKIQKVCATSGKIVDRYLFLFNDMLLICSEHPFTFVGLSPKYSVRQVLDVDGMQVVEGTNAEIPHTFYIKTRKKAVELSAKDEEEKATWHQVLWKVVGDRMRNKTASPSSNSRQKTIRKTFVSDEALGKQAPLWIHNTQVTQCMMCATEFTTFRKKHHCRACGCVICGKCSLRTAPLPYDDMKEHKVCDGCYLILAKDQMSPVSKGDQHFKRRRKEFCVISGYLRFLHDTGRKWEKRWLELHEGGALFCFKAEQDVCPIFSLEIKDFVVTVCSHEDDKSKVLKLQHTSDELSYNFAEEEKLILRWHKAALET